MYKLQLNNALLLAISGAGKINKINNYINDGIEQIYICTDNDEAGSKSMEDIKNILNATKIEIIDNREILKNYNVKDFNELLQLKKSSLNNCSYHNAVEMLCKHFDITIKGQDILRKKYEDNIRAIQKIDDVTYYYLSAFLVSKKSNHLDTLETIIGFFNNNIKLHVKDRDNRFVISSSIRNLESVLDKKHSTIIPIINSFCILGMLEKVPIANTEIQYDSKYKNDITVFYVHKFTDELLTEAERKAKVLLEKGDKVTISKLTKVTCLKKFGQEFTNKIYLNN